MTALLTLGYSIDDVVTCQSIVAGLSRKEMIAQLGGTQAGRVQHKRNIGYGILKAVLAPCRAYLTDIMTEPLPTEPLTTDEFACFLGFRSTAHCSVITRLLPAVRHGGDALKSFREGAGDLPLPTRLSPRNAYKNLDDQGRNSLPWSRKDEVIFALRFPASGFKGLTHAAIAGRVGLSRQSVIAHEQKMLVDLGVSNKVRLLWPPETVKVWRDWYVNVNP
jgi:DNA-binding CsgD family transcriptional regulator